MLTYALCCFLFFSTDYNSETGEVTWGKSNAEGERHVHMCCVAFEHDRLTDTRPPLRTTDKPEELWTEEEKAAAAGGGAAAAEQPEWMATEDEGSGMTYYYNTITGEVTWDPPPGFAGATGPPPMDIMEKMKLAMAGKLQDPEMRRKLAEAKAAREAALASQTIRWAEVYDPNAEAFYYWNPDDGSVTWPVNSSLCCCVGEKSSFCRSHGFLMACVCFAIPS